MECVALLFCSRVVRFLTSLIYPLVFKTETQKRKLHKKRVCEHQTKCCLCFSVPFCCFSLPRFVDGCLSLVPLAAQEILCREEPDLQPGTNLLLPVLAQIIREPLSPDNPHMRDSCHRLAGALKVFTGTGQEGCAAAWPCACVGVGGRGGGGLHTCVFV